VIKLLRLLLLVLLEVAIAVDGNTHRGLTILLRVLLLGVLGVVVLRVLGLRNICLLLHRGRHLVHLRLALVLLVVDGRLEERHAAAVALEAPEHGLDRGHHSEDVAIALVGLLITPLVFSIGAQALILVTSDIDGAP